MTQYVLPRTQVALVQDQRTKVFNRGLDLDLELDLDQRTKAFNWALDCECWQCMALVEESESVKMVKGLKAGVDITEKVLRVARRHVTELLDPEVREGGGDGLHHHLGPQHLRLQAAGRVDLAVEVHLVEGWRPGVGCLGQDVVGIDLGRLGAGQVVPLALVAVELGLGLVVVRGLVDKVGLDQAQIRFHILPR